ncbi:MAG TPA: PAS domain-containing protein [Methanobacterium sp.]|nr:PAS domain-containing protein [Methanobacterium sp.]
MNNFKEEAFDKSPIGILFYDKKGKLLDANQSALEITEIHSLDDFKKFNLFDDLNFRPKKEKLLKNGFIKFQAHLDFENVPVSKKSNVSIDWTVSVSDSGFLVMIQNISESKSDLYLLESEEKYRRWFEDDLTGDFIATVDGNILECNPAFVEIYGFNNRENAVKSNISKFNTNDWTELIVCLKKERIIHDYQSWHKSPSGKEIHVVANVVGIFDDHGELIQVKGYVFDDTERKKAEESLQESEAKYHSLFDEDLTGDFIATLDGKILECNPAFADIYGFYDCDQALKWNISEANSFDWPYIVTRLRKERKIQGFQSWQRRSDGRRIHVVANVVGIFNGSNELIRVKGYVFDDTERKNAEDELNKSKSQFKEILDSIQDGFMALDTQWRLIYVNKCAGEYFGIDPDELIGQNFWERFPELKGTTYETIFHNAIEMHEIQRFESHGALISDQWFDFSVYPSEEGISVFWRDIKKQ